MESYEETFHDDRSKMSPSSSTVSIPSMVLKPPSRVSVVKSVAVKPEEDSAPTISTVYLSRETSFLETSAPASTDHFAH